jgi:hypothetical protein
MRACGARHAGRRKMPARGLALQGHGENGRSRAKVKNRTPPWRTFGLKGEGCGTRHDANRAIGAPRGRAETSSAPTKAREKDGGLPPLSGRVPAGATWCWGDGGNREIGPPSLALRRAGVPGAIAAVALRRSTKSAQPGVGVLRKAASESERRTAPPVAARRMGDAPLSPYRPGVTIGGNAPENCDLDANQHRFPRMVHFSKSLPVSLTPLINLTVLIRNTSRA